MGAGMGLVDVMDVEAEGEVVGEGVFEAEVTDELVAGCDGAMGGGGAAVEVVVVGMDGGGDVVLEGEVGGHGMAGCGIEEFADDGDEPCFVGARSGDVGEVFFGMEVLVFTGGEAFLDKEAEGGDP